MNTNDEVTQAPSESDDRWITQTKFGGGGEGSEPGNCFAACLASLLRLSLDDVPNFVADPDAWPDNKNAWLRERGYGYTWWVIRREDGSKVAPGDELRQAMRAAGIESVGYHLLYGTSERGLQHAVVALNGEVVHDPHPSRAGLTVVNGLGLVFPLDPGRRASNRDRSLSVSFEDGALVVRIGLDTLVTSAEQGPMWPRLKVLDADRFGRELAGEIETDEDESGLTGMMKLIDRAVERLVEDCSEAIEWREDDEALEVAEP